MSEDNKEVKKAVAKNKKNPLVPILLVVVLVLGGAAFYFYNQNQDARTNPDELVNQQNDAESEEVVNNLKTVLLIDTDKKATVARVEDPEVLKKNNPDFYKNAEQGDYLVLYPARAIIFRNGEGKIINIAPIVNTDEFKNLQKQPGGNSGNNNQNNPQQ